MTLQLRRLIRIYRHIAHMKLRFQRTPASTLAALILVQSMVFPASLSEAETIQEKGVDHRPTLLILGIPHTANLDGYQPGMLDGLISDLVQFDPDIIAFESINPAFLNSMVRDPTQHETALSFIFEDRVGAAVRIQDETGLSWRQAKDTCLDRSTKNAIDSVRACVAALDLPNALLIYAISSENERTQLRVRDPDTHALLEKWLVSNHELTQLVLPLVMQSPAQTITSIDDYAYLGLQDRAVRRPSEAFDDVLTVWNRDYTSLTAKKEAEITALALSAGDLRLLVEFLNSRDAQLDDYSLQWAPMEGPDANAGPLSYRAFWEVRNLRMAANLSETLASNPEARVIVIIGASHLNFFDDYFSAQDWLRVVDLKTELGQAK